MVMCFSSISKIKFRWARRKTTSFFQDKKKKNPNLIHQQSLNEHTTTMLVDSAFVCIHNGEKTAVRDIENTDTFVNVAMLYMYIAAELPM